MFNQENSRIMLKKFTSIAAVDNHTLTPEQVIEVAAVKAFGKEKVNISFYETISELMSGAFIPNLKEGVKNIFFVKGYDVEEYFQIYSFGRVETPELFLSKEELTKLMVYINVVVQANTKVYLIQDNNFNFELTSNTLQKADINYKQYEFGSSHIMTILVTDSKGDIKVNQGVKYDSKTAVLHHIISQYFDLIITEKQIVKATNGDDQEVPVPITRGGFYLGLSKFKDDPNSPIAEIKSVEDIIDFVDKHYDEIKYKGKIKDNVLVIN